ncbi:formylglycine-generating enzyme family protein [Candidatus Nitronereus thalassa]|uniref:Formylglycine-generating enzyme family protein n=1 Tax=Candidatus Nitronereus thalassa TaxID=3020898 RepID=A0ABU3K822_9BACT|nr:formylglycine-generating enzyme family protein [Candidatus Nitronereus thalassa]MDT7042512.1 formylglycine-generating enzyme family protein [Candidatus Nitronereus thalassa]
MNTKLITRLLLGLIFCHLPAWANHPEVERDDVSMVNIPAGNFIRGSSTGMGRSDEMPREKIYIDAFSIDKFEVTNKRYLAFIAATGHKEPYNVYEEGSLFKVTDIHDLPVVQVTWHDAADYCQWVGKRLPTEAEWEKAARGTDGRMFPWGDEKPSSLHANYDRDWADKATLKPVGSLPQGASPYGVHDMSGNAREWVQDWYDKDYYAQAPKRNPRGPDKSLLKVIRGGSWRSFDSDIRAAARGKGGFALKTHGTGFRCARDMSTEHKIRLQGPE